MSTRALRKLQRQQEEQRQRHDAQEDASTSEDDAPHLKRNAFDLLGQQDGEDEMASEASAAEEVEVQVADVPRSAPQPSKAKKKKKQKKKSKKATPRSDSKQTAASTQDEAGLDEIDRALLDLSIQQSRLDEQATSLNGKRRSDENEERLCAILAIEPRKLNSINEMKKLFGNVVLEGRHSGSASPSPGRRRGRNRQAIDLGRALTGEFSPASRGQSLSGVTLRKNVLMQGKDEWPHAPSGGLGMEVVQKSPSDVTEYKLVHNTAYRDVQLQFDMCVESMEPERMIQLLQFNPYHISTLLQVSEIAKHQGDHAVAADLLERALFNIGRSVHSSFGDRLKEGKARMDFNIQENREMWLVGWRYIMSLGMKGTWKTAYEWAKLLLSLDPDDPYCIHLMIDQLAIRGREYQQFASLCEHPTFCDRWKPFPNIQCSLALAYFHQGKPKESREQLRFAITKFPWIFCRLAQELNIEPVPQPIWGVVPPNETQSLLCELYMARSKDIWNTPEVISLLVEVADTVQASSPMDPPEITLNLARHVVLSDVRQATSYLPRAFLRGRISASDPLPPGEIQSESLLQQSPSLFDEARRAFGFPFRRLRGRGNNVEEEEDYDDGDDDDDYHRAEDSDASENIDVDTAERYILHEGMNDLREFVQVNGIDPGNWDDDTDTSALIRWVRHLRRLHPDTWYGHISSAAEALESPLVAGLLLAELEEQGEEWATETLFS
ncbi:hypothetical protein VTO42DRAFT_2742 [Malbranchea cinnamomea]